MSQARRRRDGRSASAAGSSEDERTLTPKVVMMELAAAEGPVSAAALAERTLLSADAVESALEALAAEDLCRVHPADDRRPARYEADLSYSAEA